MITNIQKLLIGKESVIVVYTKNYSCYVTGYIYSCSHAGFNQCYNIKIHQSFL